MTSMEFLEHLDPLLPIDFFSVALQIPKKSHPKGKGLLSKGHALPDLTSHLGEEKFADVYLVWNDEGIAGQVEFHKPFEHSALPSYQEGESVEIFIDTRDMKKAGWATRFCHHFVFLAHPVQQIQAQEMTRFRSEDAHPLCDPALLEVHTKYGKNGFTMDFFIPKACLHGFDPSAFSRIGLTYKINRYKGPAQHFSVSSHYFDIMQHPSLWSSVRLVNE